MREQLIQYVNLLFSGAQDAEDIRLEILQNTLDRYDDMIAAGKVPEAAYRLAISGIGDIREILTAASGGTFSHASTVPEVRSGMGPHKTIRAIAIALYILCPVPLFVLNDIGMDTIGLCGLLGMVAIATILMILSKNDRKSGVAPSRNSTVIEGSLRKSIHALLWALGTVAYLIVSFLTEAWLITWLIFPITGSLQGIVDAILDLKEG